MVLLLVLPGQTHEEDDHDRYEHDDDPRAVRELEDGDHDVDDKGQERAEAVDEQPPAPTLLLLADVVLGHAGLRQRERREHADRVQRDEPVDLGVGGQQQDDRGDREEDDPVRENEPMAALRELAGHEVVTGVEGREAGKVGKARIGREHEDEHRAGLQAVVEDVAERAAAVGELADLRDDGRCAVGERRDLHLGVHDRQPEEHDAEQ